MALPYIPLPYRFLLLWFEPLAAFNGAVLCHFLPTTFLNTMSAKAIYEPSHQIIFDQLAATYVLFAWNQAVVLRIAQDLRVWKAIVLGILICDTIHLYGSFCALGSEAFFNPALWRAEDVVNFAMLYGPMALRVGLLFEVGIKRGDAKRE